MLLDHVHTSVVAWSWANPLPVELHNEKEHPAKVLLYRPLLTIQRWHNKNLPKSIIYDDIALCQVGIMVLALTDAKKECYNVASG